MPLGSFMGGKGIDFIIRTVYDSAGLKQAELDMKKFQATSKMPAGGFEKSFATVTQAERELARQSTLSVKSQQQLAQAVRETGEAIDEMGGQPGSPVKKAEINIASLMKRAAVTIPVWYGLRTAMNALIDTFREGIQYIRDFDAGMAKIKATLIGTPNLEQIMGEISNEVKRLALETGTSLTEVTDTFYSFTEAGISAQDALKAFEPTLKANVAMMGDASETARTAAGIYNVMGDTITEVSDTTDKFKLIFGIMFKLWQTNAFQANEFNEALNNFAGSAKTFGISLREMMMLLAVAHTLLQRGSTAGTMFTRAFIQLGKNIDAVNRYLKRIVDLKTEKHFEILIEIIEKLREEFDEFGKVGDDVYKIFDIRAGKLTATMVAGLALVRKELEGISDTDVRTLFETVLQGFEVQMETVNRQLNRFRLVRGELGQAFMIGITGTEDFDKSLEKITGTLKTLIPYVKELGEAIKLYTIPLAVLILASKGLISSGLAAAALGAIAIKTIEETLLPKPSKQLTEKEIEDIRKKVKEGINVEDIFKDLGLSTEKFWLKFGKGAAPIERLGEAASIIAEEQRKIMKELLKIDLERIEVVREKTDKDKITNIELSRQLIYAERLKTLGYSQLQIEMAKLKLLEESISKTEEQIEAQEGRVIAAYQEEIIKLSSTLQSAFEEGFAGILKSESTVIDMIRRIGEVWRNTWIEQVAGGLTESLFQITGIGEIFGTTMFNVKAMFGGLSGKIEGAHSTVYDFILKAHKDGAIFIEAAIQGKPIPTIAGVPMGIGGGGGLGGVTLPGFGGGGFFTQPFGTPDYTYAGNITRNAQGQLVGTRKLATPTRGQALGMGMQSAMIGYSMYQSAGGRAGGAGAVMQGLGGVGLALGASGAFAATGMLAALGPVGWIIAGALLLGGILIGGGKKTQRQVEVRTEDRQISSRIDITNKQLEIVNRNLIAIRATFETYILPSSFYFREKRNLEDEFAISSNRGFGG